MLKQARAEAMIPAQDLERAKSFYKEKLGLTPTEEDPGGVRYELADGTKFGLFKSGGAPSGTHTQIGFVVDDLVKEVKELKSKGAKFEEYDSPGLKTTDSIAEVGPGKAAWLKDSEGNVLAVVQMVPVTAGRPA
ncbi:MAG TPA: VOC family protein [Candidatus Dormibacteraeota bacterium]|jgi:predicted enzyme related to lactoylglutathione lyase